MGGGGDLIVLFQHYRFVFKKDYALVWPNVYTFFIQTFSKKSKFKKILQRRKTGCQQQGLDGARDDQRYKRKAARITGDVLSILN